ncbi:MAG TPA: regulatory protein RecX [Candidatus Avoscillospira avistercoris]|uniref:Regulatory protein RecX n=1 Tax=Candidatus Avoscillospira avistercoris TaxID=2840707 RepID=A0A9D1F957_9FIRM|nr:regulatory protein RecX [Candidatus Avoscillospira avistercoris]
MKIESLREPTVRGGRYTVTLDDGRRLRLEQATVGEFALYPGRELTAEELDQIRAANQRASAKARAVRIISATNVSKKDLERRLVQKGETPELASEAVQWLTELNLLDDLETARQLAQSAARKGYGAARIRQILYQKGIDRQLWDEAMEELPEPDDAIDRFLQSRFKGEKPDERETKRAVDALLRRGHRWADIRSAMARYTDALNDIMEEF